MKSKIRVLFSFVFLATALYAAFNIIKIQSEYKKGVDAYSEMDEYAVTNIMEGAGEERSEAEDPEPYPNVDFTGLKSVNDEVNGWIFIPDTEINYPTVHTGDNDFYLSHMADKSENAAGAIFLDTRNNDDYSDIHSIIYGHHMKNGTMFAALKGYKRQDFFDSHRTGYLVTEGGAYRIDFFAGHVANVEEDAWRLDFAGDDDFESWIAYLKETSAFISDITPQAGDRVLTLSTCSYEFDDARFVLSGRMTKIQ